MPAGAPIASGSQASPLASPPISAVYTESGLHVWALGNSGRLSHMKLDSSTWYSPSWESEGGQFSNAPAAASRGNGHFKFEVLAPAADGRVLYQAERQGWFANQQKDSIGGTVTSPLSAASWGPERIDVIGIGPERQVLHKALDANHWLPSKETWETLGGSCHSAAGPLEIVSWGPGRVDIIALATDNAVWHKSWEGGRWSPSQMDWNEMGGKSNLHVAAVAWGPNRLDAFGVGTDNEVYHKYWDGSQWQPSKVDWTALGGSFMSRPAVISRGFSQLDIFCVGTDHQMYYKAWNSSRWEPSEREWTALGGDFLSAPRAVYHAGRLDIFCKGRDEHIYHMNWEVRQWRSLAKVL